MCNNKIITSLVRFSKSTVASIFLFVTFVIFTTLLTSSPFCSYSFVLFLLVFVMVIFYQVNHPLRFVSQFVIAMTCDISFALLVPSLMMRAIPSPFVASSSPLPYSFLAPSFSLFFLLFQTLLFFDFSCSYS